MAVGNLPIENYVPVVKLNKGLYSKLSMTIATGATVTLPSTTTIGGSSVSALGIVTSTSANALAVGRQGATNPVFNIDASAATVVTGINIAGAAAASGVAVAVTSSGTNENLTIDAKGSGTISLNVTGTGNIVLGRAATGVSASMTAGYAALSGTAVPASAGALAAGAPITMFSTGIKIWVTSDTPAFSATKGDLAINTGGSSSSTRLFINNGTTNWVAVTTAS